MKQYHDLMRRVLAEGVKKEDRTGTNWQSYVIKLHEKKGVITSDEVLNRMPANGIEVQVGSYDQSHGACKN